MPPHATPCHHATPCYPMRPHATPWDRMRSAHMPEKQNMPICEVTWLQSRVLPAAVRALLSAARMAMMRSAIWLHSARHCASSLGSPSTWLGVRVGGRVRGRGRGRGGGRAKVSSHLLDDARAVDGRVAIHGADDELELRLEALSLLRAAAHHREQTHPLAVEAEVLGEGLCEREGGAVVSRARNRRATVRRAMARRAMVSRAMVGGAMVSGATVSGATVSVPARARRSGRRARIGARRRRRARRRPRRSPGRPSRRRPRGAAP